MGSYTSVQGSNFDFDDDDSHFEIDYGAGLSGDLEYGIEWDIGISYYIYPDLDIELDYDYIESYIGISYTLESMPLLSTLEIKFWYTPDYFEEDDDTIQLEGKIDFMLLHDFVLSAHACYQSVDGDKTSGPEVYT